KGLFDRGLRLAFLALQNGAGLEADDRDLMARMEEGVVGLAELGILEVGRQYTGNFHRGSSFAAEGRLISTLRAERCRSPLRAYGLRASGSRSAATLSRARARRVRRKPQV